MREIGAHLVALSDGNEASPSLARYAIRTNQFGQAFITEGTVTLGLGGNYNNATVLEILISQSGRVEYYIDNVLGACHFAIVSVTPDS